MDSLLALRSVRQSKSNLRSLDGFKDNQRAHPP